MVLCSFLLCKLRCLASKAHTAFWVHNVDNSLMPEIALHSSTGSLFSPVLPLFSRYSNLINYNNINKNENFCSFNCISCLMSSFVTSIPTRVLYLANRRVNAGINNIITNRNTSIIEHHALN